MFDVQFEAGYPLLSKVLNSMFLNSGEGATGGSAKEKLNREIKACLEAKHEVQIFQAIWGKVGENIESFNEYSLRSYYYFGASSEVRQFVRQLWVTALQSWPQGDQQKFLRLIIDDKKFDIFEGFDFAVSIFSRVHVPADFMANWIIDARKALGDDMMQHGFWACVEGYTTAWPADAQRILIRLIAVPLTDELRDVVARMLHWLRQSNQTLDLVAANGLNDIEKTLCAPGRSELRAVYFQSLAFSAASPEFDEIRAENLYAQLVNTSGEEELSWSFLLFKAIELNPQKWSWAYRELMKLAKKYSNPTSKYWLINSALTGWKLSRPESAVSKPDWESLFFAIGPLAAGEPGLWNKLESFLVEVITLDFKSTKEFVLKIAIVSGREWASQIRERPGGFSRFARTIQEQGYANEIITDLCFAKDRQSRALGVYLYSHSALAELQPASVANSDAVQLELLVLEVAVMVTDQFNQVARLHASLAPRISEIGGSLAAMFYDEVSLHALNTDGYRGALKLFANAQPKLLACVEEANLKIEAIAEAYQSPALQMMVRGRKRAEIMEMRRFTQQISLGVEKHSLFSQLCTNVPVLYGSAWRMADPVGNLTGAQGFQRSEVSMEVPRLEFINPERMQLRRLSANTRISELEKIVDARK